MAWDHGGVKHSPETRRVLRDLGKELEAAGNSAGQKLVWSASDQLILSQISSVLDRKAELLALYEAAEDLDVMVKLSAEVRLLESAAARLVKLVKTDIPAPESRRSVMARQAANARWGNAPG